MRIAIVSDIHGNRSAFEAVLKDLREASPDLILHGGDLADSGSSPIEILDQMRDFAWPGVAGNTDEMLFRPESLDEHVPGIPQLKAMAEFSREKLGEERIAWLRNLPRTWTLESLALVHASPDSLWRTPKDDAEFATLERPLAVYGHTHKPFVRDKVANSGSVGLPYDGDQRASYLLIDDYTPTIRRVAYDVEREIKALAECGIPHSAWVAEMLKKAAPTPPVR